METGLEVSQLETSDSSPAQGHGHESSVKVVEVTAKQVLDRIMTNCSSSDSPTGNQGSAYGNANGNVRSGSISSTSIVEGEVNTNGVSGRHSYSGQGTPSPSVSTKSEHPGASLPHVQDKNSALLLEVIQRWVKEASNGKGGRSTNALNVSQHGSPYYLYSIESFLRDLSWTSQEALGQKFVSHFLKWLKKLFHFQEGGEGEVEYNAILPHWDKLEGVVAMTKWHLHLQYPNYMHNGYEAFSENGHPVIYSSDEDMGLHVTSSLGLSKECISLVDTTKSDWAEKLEQVIMSDRKRGIMPVIILLNIGKSSKNLEKGCRLSEIKKVAVHFYGRNTFSYFVKRPESEQIGSSFTIDLNNWIPSPPLPLLTIFKKPAKSDGKRLQLCGLTSLNKSLMNLSPWFCTEVFGHTNTKAYIEEVCERGQFLLTILKKYDFLKIVPNWSTLTDGQVIVSSLIFRFSPKATKNGKSSPGNGSVEAELPSAQYINVLNSWLYHILERDVKHHLHVEFVDVERAWNILIDVFKTDKFSLEDEEFLDKTFDHHMRVLQSTLSKKSEFMRLVAQAVELEVVDYDKTWAGLGAVRYIPKFYREIPEKEGRKTTPPPQAIQDSTHMKGNINHLNAQIVDKLKSIDNAFSLGVYGDGDWCVQFGMVTDETEVSELLRLVVSAGEEIEESSEFFQEMSELIKKGIEKATEELKRESEEALWEEGILRKVPVVGTFVNWFSPPGRETGIRGRALNLAQGKVESTENIYKFHMQLQAPPSPNSSPSQISSNSILSRMSSRNSITK